MSYARDMAFARVLPLLSLIGACGRPPTCDSSEFICDSAAYRERQIADLVDEMTPPDPTEGTWIELVRTPGCLGDPDFFRVSVRVRGSTDDTSRVDIWESQDGAGFNEAHVFATSSVATGEELLVELHDGATPAQYASGSKTTYVCGVTDVGQLLTYAVRVYDPAGNLADCAMFSTDPEPSAAIAAAFAGQLPEPNAIASRSQINPENCRTWSLPPG